MLGWEYPPVFSGGLGIATHGLAIEIARRANLTLILPHNAVPDHDLFRIIGIHDQSLDRDNVKDVYASSKNINLLKLSLPASPYEFMNHQLEQVTAAQKTRGLHTASNSPFEDRELYGRLIMSKVEYYKDAVQTLASVMRFDVIHAHDWMTFRAGAELKGKTGKPLILHVHALETDRSGSNARNEIYWLEKKSMDMADQLIAVSHYTKAQLVAHYQIDAARIHVVHNGINPIPTKRINSPFREKTVLFLGRLTHQKGPKYLLETLEKLVRVYPDVKFIVAGTGDQFTYILEQSARKRLGEKILFTGFLNKQKVEELLSIADVYFMPSVSEPFGLTALEAAQFGIPCVLSEQSGAVEVLSSSLRCSFWDTDAFANFIYGLLVYEPLMKEMSKNAQSEASDATWASAAEKIINLYHSL
jgi:glycogen synthase